MYAERAVILVSSIAVLFGCQGDLDDVAGGGTAEDETPDEKDVPPTETPDPALTRAAERYAECLTFYNGKDWEQLRGCYHDDVVQEEPDTGSPPWVGVDAAVEHLKLFATSFPDGTIDPQITLVTGNQIVSLSLLRGTNTGPLPGHPTPTGEKIGYFIGHTVALDAAGLITAEWIVYDHRQLVGQLGLGPPVARPMVTEGSLDASVVLATGTDVEAQNLAIYQGFITAFNAHDEALLRDRLAVDLVWSELSLPNDLDTEDLVARTVEMWGGFSDLRRSPEVTWAAGDYVAATGKLTGTNDGTVPSLGLSETGNEVTVEYVEIAHFTGGRWDRSWLSYNGAAVESQLGVELE